jgi:hypothetical protein
MLNYSGAQADLAANRPRHSPLRCRKCGNEACRNDDILSSSLSLTVFTLLAFRKGPVSEVEELVLHLVGARKAELELAGSWTLLPARLPRLR